MSLILDTSRALRTHDELVSLVRAVVAASPEDESRSLEWKSGYDDLLSAEASFALARAVLGLANRSVEVAQAHFEGLGYIIVGAEPGQIQGQTVPDSAELLNAIRRYTGPTYPSWDPRTVSVDGAAVLVITVEAPTPGDRISLLRKAYQPPKGSMIPDGTIFVRHSGASERATREDIEMLQDRLLGGLDKAVEAALQDSHKQRQRTLLAGILHAVRNWMSTMEILTIMSASGRWKQSDWDEWVNTDSGRAMAESMQIIKDNSRKLRLETTHPNLINALNIALATVERPAEFDCLYAGRATTGDERSAAYGHLGNIGRAFSTLEQVGIDLLAVPTTPAEHRQASPQ